MTNTGYTDRPASSRANVRPMLARLGVLAALVLLALDAFLIARFDPNLGLDDAVGIVSVTAMSLIGALVASRRPANSVGWLLLAAATLLHLQGTAQDYAQSAFQDGAPRHLAAWISMWSGSPRSS